MKFVMPWASSSGAHAGEIYATIGVKMGIRAREYYLDHAPGNHLIDGIVLFGEEERFLTRDEQGMVVCHLAVVHAAACRG